MPRATLVCSPSYAPPYDLLCPQPRGQSILPSPTPTKKDPPCMAGLFGDQQSVRIT